jgi:hypothetical protein
MANTKDPQKPVPQEPDKPEEKKTFETKLGIRKNPVLGPAARGTKRR